jgi:Site-specific recombinase XerC
MPADRSPVRGSAGADWDHVDLDAGTISVWRSVRAHGDTKTNRSRRTLRIPQIAVEALQEQLRRQAEERSTAGELWQEHGLVFTTTVGTPYESHNLRRDFRKVTAAAGLGARWVPKELRTSFVSMMSYQGVPGRGDRPPGRPCQLPHHRSRLPP